MVDAVRQGQQGLKSALYAKQLACDARAVYALASGTLSKKKALQASLARAGLLEGKAKTSGANARKKLAQGEPPAIATSELGVALVMAYDLLLGQGLRGGGRLSRLLKESRKDLEEAFRANGHLAAESADVAATKGMVELPRYLRINRTRVGGGAPAAEQLRKKLQEALVERLRRDEKPAADGLVECDKLVPDVLVVHARARPLLHGLPLVDDAQVVLQDRSSCLAALSAGITPNAVVLDACAAPGSKTAHIIDVLADTGVVIACERDPGRAVSLVRRLRDLVLLRRPGASSGGKPGTATDTWFDKIDEASFKEGSVWKFRAGPSGGTQVELHVGDFLNCRPDVAPFKDVDVVVADPSCSGSGLPEHHLDVEAAPPSAQRLRRLAAFQGRILRHACKFPRARTVVYSTCSVHRAENEAVVASAMLEGATHAFGVVDALPWWRGQGPGAAESPGPSWDQWCVRCDPSQHRCRGFFLCRLDRMRPDDPALKQQHEAAHAMAAQEASRPVRAAAGTAAKTDDPLAQLRPRARARKRRRLAAREAAQRVDAGHPNEQKRAAADGGGRGKKRKPSKGGGLQFAKRASKG